MKDKLALVGLFEEAIFTGEERELRAPAVDTPTLVALDKAQPERACAVTVASSVEVPSFVGGRFATVCEVVAVSPERIVLRGVSRARIVETQGKQPPYWCRAEAAKSDARPGALLDGARELVEALRQGAVPARADWQERIREPIASLLRAVSEGSELRGAAALDLEQAVAQAAGELAQNIDAARATSDLEEMLAAAKARGLTQPMRRRLWAQVVEVQKALDVYDPGSGDNESDLLRLSRRLRQAGLPQEASELAKRELRMLRGMETSHHDYSTYFSHLDLMARLSWHPETLPPIDLDRVQRSLDAEHAGLEKPKRRVLEHLAVRALGGASQHMILCLAGPPGTGKTTLSRVVAEALSRKFIRVPLGGVHDESEIRGHRKSFTAAGPGRIVDGFARAGTATPVVLLDEIDKIGTDTQRSPAAALLEVLDPEQNPHFSDNYLATPYDLSHAIFITTANDVSRIHPIVLDRLEVIELDGYDLGEKIVIAEQHLLERLRIDHGLPARLELGEAQLATLIEGWTREPGVRQLSRALSALYRDKAFAAARGTEPAMTVSDEEMRAVLGPRRHRECAQDSLPVGAATGLSVSGEGGALLFVEIVALGERRKLRMTGQLGAVLRESVRAALAHLRANAERYGIDPAALERELHLHLPEAAISKDGPSAGLAIACALASLAHGAPVPADLAMTGEITLGGRVLPVGGVRQKLLAADRAGIARVLVPRDNAPDVPAGITARVIPVARVGEALDLAFPAARSQESASDSAG